MTTQDTPDPEDRFSNIVMLLQSMVQTEYQEALFERFDKLHKRNISDDDVIKGLRYIEETQLAERYLDWSGALDPDTVDDLNTTNPVVPDPTDAPSYAQHPLRMQLAGPGTVVDTIEQLALLTDGVVLALKGGYAGQIRRDDTSHYLSIAGSDIWSTIMDHTFEGGWEIVSAADRRELAVFLPATILGAVK